MKKAVTYYLKLETIEKVENHAEKHFGNKSKVIEAAVKEYLEKKDDK